MLVGRYSARRFAAQSDEDVRDLHSYIWNTSVMKGSGEFCISESMLSGTRGAVLMEKRIFSHLARTRDYRSWIVYIKSKSQ
jgi:cardiolipin-specific phospholipase